MKRLDWSGKKRKGGPAHPVNHWMGGSRRPCRICGNPTWLCDDSQTPCHKVCAEGETAQSKAESQRKVA